MGVAVLRLNDSGHSLTAFEFRKKNVLFLQQNVPLRFKLNRSAIVITLLSILVTDCKGSRFAEGEMQAFGENACVPAIWRLF